jgi:hypothetical protein
MSLGNAYTFRMPYSIPGDFTRGAGSNKVKAEAFGATAFASYGIPAKLSANTVIPISAVGDGVYGFLMRPFPTQGPNASDPLGTSVPPTSGVANVSLSGYVGVVCNAGAPNEGSPVYVRYANGVTATPVGGIEATSVPGSNVVIPNCYFTGPVDANNFGEVAFNI